MASEASTSTWTTSPRATQQHIPPGNNENILEFDAAMSQFKSMFPNINAAVIEKVLRSHNGDVTNTINELLTFSADSSTTATASRSDASSQGMYAGELSPDEKSKRVMNRSDQTTSTNPTHNPPRSNCADDEKIALLMQNREFLEYLQNDARFMREIGGYSPSSQHYSNRRSHIRPWNTVSHCSATVCAPPMMESSRDRTWRICAPPTSYCYAGQRYPYNMNSGDVTYSGHRLYDTSYQSYASELAERFQPKERPQALPNGPVVECGSDHIPEGPLIDYCGQASKTKNWSQRVKSHLPRIGKTQKFTNDHENDQMVAATFVDYSTTDDNFTHRLRNMSKSSKEMFLSLARRFSLKNSHTSETMSADFANRFNKLRDDRHFHEKEFREKEKS